MAAASLVSWRASLTAGDILWKAGADAQPLWRSAPNPSNLIA